MERDKIDDAIAKLSEIVAYGDSKFEHETLDILRALNENVKALEERVKHQQELLDKNLVC